MRATTHLACLATLVLLAGCGGGQADRVLGGGGDDPAADASIVKAIEEATAAVDAMTDDAMAAEATAVEGDPMLTAIGRPTPASVDRSIERTIPCPGGGELLVTGTLNGEFDRDTRTLELEGSGSREAIGCVLERRGMTLTLDGASSWSWNRRLVEGMLDGLQTRSASGSWTVTDGEGTTRSCEFEYSLVYDPETRELTVSGTMCGGPLRAGLGWKVG